MRLMRLEMCTACDDFAIGAGMSRLEAEAGWQRGH